MAAVAVASGGCVASAGADFPPLCVEIGPEHPLFIFEVSCGDFTNAGDYARHVIQAWTTLPKEFAPYSVMLVDARGTGTAERQPWLRETLVVLQDADVPVVLRVADGTQQQFHPLERVEELVREFAWVKGIQAVRLAFEEYPDPGTEEALGPRPVARWLVEAIDLAARYGRFISIDLDQIRWPRVMSSVGCRPVLEKMRECSAYVIPIASCRGAHVIPQMSALLGLWLEGASAQWGVGPDSRWYGDAHFLQPGQFGVSNPPAAMPVALYRAMILNGAMTGATVYSFAMDADLWFGATPRSWDEAIAATLSELLDLGLIARKDFVLKKTRVAYQLASASTPEDFHLNLRDIDGVLDKGFLMHGAYGMERPGQIPEIIPNSGRFYWIPILSAFATEAVSPLFENILKPDPQTSESYWTTSLDKYYTADGEGSAFITSVGRGVFILNTRENQQEQQTFKIPAVPAPVRQLEAGRKDNGVLLSWPFRGGDLSYNVYKRVLPAARRTRLAKGIEERRYLDEAADASQTIAYSVSALTDDKEPYEGIVNYGEYLALSNVESRVAEEAVIGPLLGLAQSKPIEKTSPPADATPWWPNLAGLDDVQFASASEIVKRIEAWDRAFAGKDLDGVLDLYSTDYEDAQRWPFTYVRRAYQWFFEHYQACAMHRQIRRWDFAAYDTIGQIGVLLYCRFEGYAVSDPTGLFADLPAHFPLVENGEVWIHFAKKDGLWRIVRTAPALPNFQDILSFSASPFDRMAPGPDVWKSK